MAIDTERLSCIALLLRANWTNQASIRAAFVESMRPSQLLSNVEDAGHWLAEAEVQLAEWEAQGLDITTYADANYPRQLRNVHDFPLALFWKGQLWEAPEPEPSVAIVGSRDASAKAREIAAWIASELPSRGISVISGLAKGVDTAAHQAALIHGGRTVGVIGTGIDRAYPRENRDLQREIADRGLLLSQFRPGSPPSKISFPMRNAVMSAFSSVTLIVEAGEDSGTKHQATAAVRHGRPIVLAAAVANETTWGRKLADHANTAEITVASNPRSALEAVSLFALRSHDISLSLA